MSIFNDAMLKAMKTHRYICNKCGADMVFEDKWKTVLVCPSCNNSMDLDMYGFADEDEYNALYPSREEVLGEEDDDEDNEGETYIDESEEYFRGFDD